MRSLRRCDVLAFLRLIPLKDYLYGGAILVLVIGFFGYRSHVIAIGESRIQAQDKVIADAQRQHNQDVNDLAAARTAKNGDHYVEVTHRPIADSPHVVCINPAPRRGPVPETAGDPGIPAAAANRPAADPLDIGPSLDRTGRDADALIVALQDEVRILVAAMNGATQ
jgi:hypothetical protein